MRVHLKTPVSYYGGKQRLIGTILPLIPEHTLYCEPFCGGAAVFWAKERSKVEVINDANREVVNFYRVLQRRFDELWPLVDATLHSRAAHEDAAVIYRHPHLFDEVKRAWAFWVQTSQSFSSKICAGWGYGRHNATTERKVMNAKARFQEVYSQRLHQVQIEHHDALHVIRRSDHEDAFFYCDPPYPESNQGHYSGYTMEHFRHLLDTLAAVNGKFLLSSYPYPLLTEYTERYGWHKKEIVQPITSIKDRTVPKMKTEVLTANYPI